jgi:membrane protein
MSSPSAPALSPAPPSERSSPKGGERGAEARTEGQVPTKRSAWGRAKLVAELFKQTFAQWQEDDAPRLAASLSLYTLLSIAPLVIILVAVAGIVFGEEAARGQINGEISAVVGTAAGSAIEGIVANARQPSQGFISTVIGVVVLLLGASGVFGELQTALNQIWNVKARPGRGLRGMLRDRFFSFTMVMGVAFLLMVSLVVSAVLATITEHYQGLIPVPFLWEGINILVGLAVSTVLFTLIFKVVPDAKIAWRDVWVGGLFTAVLFSIGKVALAWYVGRSATVSPFGAAGSLVALVVWVYYSAQILFFGAEFAQVYATLFGLQIIPTENAVRADELPPRRSSKPPV